MAEACLLINGNPATHKLSRSKSHRPSLSYKPAIITMSQNQAYWATVSDNIEAHLKQALPVRPPLSVFEPMHHLVFRAPRNTAPALCIAACELVGGDRDHAMAAASALHLAHAAAYTHDHLPLTDMPGSTIDHVYSPNIELLTPDAILPFGFELLAKSDDPAQHKSERILRVIVEITRATGSEWLIDGQYHEWQLNGRSYGQTNFDMNLINRAAEKREGGLHACAAACGAILGGGSEEEIEMLRRYGMNVGTIQGLSSYCNILGRKEEIMKRIEELKIVAFQGLEGFFFGGHKEFDEFKGRNMDEIASFLEI